MKKAIVFGATSGIGKSLTEILIKEDDHRWKVGGEGNHRALVLTILGYKYVDCKINKIIRYEDAKFWPNVINGLFTTKQAQIIFMRFFDAKPPKSYSQWNDYCKKMGIKMSPMRFFKISWYNSSCNMILIFNITFIAQSVFCKIIKFF